MSAVRRPLWRVRLNHWLTNRWPDFLRLAFEVGLCAACLALAGCAGFLLLSFGV